MSLRTTQREMLQQFIATRKITSQPLTLMIGGGFIGASIVTLMDEAQDMLVGLPLDITRLSYTALWILGAGAILAINSHMRFGHARTQLITTARERLIDVNVLFSDKRITSGNVRRLLLGQEPR